MTEKADMAAIPGLENTVSSLRNRIDELESLLRQKEGGSNGEEKLEIPVLDEVFSMEDAGYLRDEEELPETGYGNALDEEQLAEIIRRLDTQITKDLEALIKLLKHSIMKEIKTTLLTELTRGQDGQVTGGITEPPVRGKFHGHKTGADNDQ